MSESLKKERLVVFRPPSALLVTGLLCFSYFNILHLLQAGPAEFPLEHELITALLRTRTYLSFFIGGIVIIAIFFSLKSRNKLPHSSIPQTQPSSQICDLSLYTLITFNIFLLYAPFSLLVPSPIQTPTSLSRASFTLEYIDALHVDLNPAFILLRMLFNRAFGLTIYASCLASISITSLAVGFFALSAQTIINRAIGWGTVLLMVTDHWLISTALCGNLIATPLLTCSILLYLILRNFFSKHTDLSAPSPVMILLMMTALFVYSLYSYAPLRLPFLVSLTFIGSAFLLQKINQFSCRLQRLAINILLPGLLSVAFLVGLPYAGDYHDLLSQFLARPSDVLPVRPETLPADYQETLLPDTPIWYRGAKSELENRCIFWLGSANEIAAAIGEHFTRIADELPWQPVLIFLFLSSMVFALVSPKARPRARLLLLSLWALIWASPFLLTPDAMAYRRAISSSAIMLLASSVFLGKLFSGRGKLQFTLFACLSLSLFPFNFTIDQELARDRFSAHCQNAFPSRELFINQALHHRQITFAQTKLQHPTTRICQNDALLSQEFSSRFSGIAVRNVEPATFSEFIASIAPGSILIIDCQPDATRDPDVEEVCSGKRSVGILHPMELRGLPGISHWWAWIEI